mmetsp:Transcript_9518/g.20577  ORF Transcript_9518/g.20577 Transcript_9518/m.20577 type:complete len:569 (+) Transcript_9518:107-1813(+)
MAAARRWQSPPALLLVTIALCPFFFALFSALRRHRHPPAATTPLADIIIGSTLRPNPNPRRRKLSESSSSSSSSTTTSAARHEHDLEHVLNLATRSPEDIFTEGGEDHEPLRVLFIVTTLAEYDKGTRGTTHGADRLKENVLPLIIDGVTSMISRGWHVDVYLICGFPTLEPSRESMLRSALPPGVGLELWLDATPYYYVKKFNQDLKHPGEQRIEPAPHGLSRQHRFVVRDKLMEYDFFTAFEDDMRITADHVVNFLEMSAEIDRLRKEAERAPDGKVHVEDAVPDRRTSRGKSMDKANVGNDLIQDPMTAEELRRLWPGFLRAEVVDTRNGEPHPLLEGVSPQLDNHAWMRHVPHSTEYESQFGTLDPNVCCGVPEGRARTPPRPSKDDLVLWETDITAMGVRRYPGAVGWAAAQPVEDRSDVGSYWSGEGHNYDDPSMKRPRRINSLLGQQAGWMATRSQILYFHEHACPGGFLPPFDGWKEWVNDSLQTRNGAVEFWSGGYQLFGKCYYNRILSLDPKRFSRQLLYHASNNKQRTVRKEKFVRISRFLGQLYTVKERALESLKG